jgi:hypothetical protein
MKHMALLGLVLLASKLASGQTSITMQTLQTDLGIGDVTPAGAETFPAWAGWEGSGRYDFVAASYTTPYLTAVSQMNNFNFVLFGSARMVGGIAQPIAPEIQALTAAQRAAIIDGDYSAVLSPPALAPGSPVQLTECARSNDGQYYYCLITVDPLALVQVYNGYTPNVSFQISITPPAGTKLRNLSLPLNPNEPDWTNVAVSIVASGAGVAIDAEAGGVPLSTIAEDLFAVLQAATQQAGSSNPSALQFASSGLGGVPAQALQQLTFLVVYQATAGVQSLNLNVSGSEAWTYSLSTTTSSTIVNPVKPSGRSSPIQMTFTISSTGTTSTSAATATGGGTTTTSPTSSSSAVFGVGRAYSANSDSYVFAPNIQLNASAGTIVGHLQGVPIYSAGTNSASLPLPLLVESNSTGFVVPSGTSAAVGGGLYTGQTMVDLDGIWAGSGPSPY